MRIAPFLAFVLGCSTPSAQVNPPDAQVSATIDAEADAPGDGTLGTIASVTDLASCPAGAPQGSTCKQVTVTGCPGIEAEAIDATVAILPTTAPVRGTIAHFKGGGGEGFLTLGTTEYQAAGYRQAFVSWNSDWEQTASHGIKTAACRPATLVKWLYDDPAVHGGSRTTAFCGEGKSGGSAQLGYALATYAMGDYLDYVSEQAGPPFARIDLGCDGDASPTSVVCGDIAYHCYSQADSCQGESLGPRGDDERIQAMLAGCTPRHP